MVGIKEHKAEMERVADEIRQAKGFHKKDLIRYYKRLEKELNYAQMQMRKAQ